MMKIFQKNLESRNICVTLQSRMTNTGNAEIAQLVEHNLAKVGVASSSLVCRSSLFMRERQNNILLLFCLIFLNLYGEVAELVDALL